MRTTILLLLATAGCLSSLDPRPLAPPVTMGFETVPKPRVMDALVSEAANRGYVVVRSDAYSVRLEKPLTGSWAQRSDRAVLRLDITVFEVSDLTRAQVAVTEIALPGEEGEVVQGGSPEDRQLVQRLLEDVRTRLLAAAQGPRG